MSDILPGSQRPGTAGVYIDDEVRTLSATALTGYTCSANDNTVNIGPAIVESMRAINESAFQNVVEASGPNRRGGNSYFIVIDDPDFQPQLDFIPQFASVSGVADAEISFRVTVYGEDGEALVRSTVSGDASERAYAGGCEGARHRCAC